jgi:hypothetical protein
MGQLTSDFNGSIYFPHHGEKSGLDLDPQLMAVATKIPKRTAHRDRVKEYGNIVTGG